MRELIFPAEIEVVGRGRALRVQHGSELDPEIISVSRGRSDGLNYAVGKWITERVQDHGVTLAAAEIGVLAQSYAIVFGSLFHEVAFQVV